MKLIKNALAFGLFAGAAAVVACSGQTAPNGTGGNRTGGPVNVGNTGNGGSVGSVQASLTIPANGAQFQSFDYTISGPSGSVGPILENIGDAQSIEWVVGGVNVGCGYTLSVTGTDSAGDVCAGTSTTFCVAAAQVTSVGLNITCTTPTDAASSADVTTGSVAVDAGITLVQQGAYTCPGISSFAISPAELLGSQLAAASVATVGPAGTITWSDSGCNGTGTLGGFLNTADGGGDTSDKSVNFSCGTCMGSTTLTASVALNVVPLGQTSPTNVCAGVQFTTISANVVCEGGGPTICTGGTSACPVTDGGNPCVNEQSDNNHCGNCTTVCNVAEGFTCSGGVCSQPAPTACQTAPCAASGPNSVECPASLAANNTCTPTEAAIVNGIDIPKKQFTGQVLSANSCYSCMVNADCIDDTTFGDTGKECGDLPAGGSLVVDGVTSNSNACLNVLNCFITSACVNANPPSPCYCGTEVGTACGSNPGNGPCVGQVIDGLGSISGDVCTGVPTSAPTANGVAGAAVCNDTTASAAAAVNLAFISASLPTGIVERITGCGFTNCATQCGF